MSITVPEVLIERDSLREFVSQAFIYGHKSCCGLEPDCGAKHDMETYLMALDRAIGQWADNKSTALSNSNKGVSDE